MNTATAKKPRLTTSAMIASIASEGQRIKAAPFGKALAELAESQPQIVGMTADLARYTDLHLCAQAHPERFFQNGHGRAVAARRGRRHGKSRAGAARRA